MSVWLGRKPCGCPTFAALERPRRTPSNGHWARGKIGGRWVDTDGELAMSRVPADQANLVLCRCPS